MDVRPAVRATQTSWRSRLPVRQERFNSAHADSTVKKFCLPLTQTQLAMAVADRAEITTAEAKRVLGALEEVVLEGAATRKRSVSVVLCS